MVRRINASSSSRLLWTAFALATCATFAHAQSADSAQQRSTAGAPFVVAPTLALPAAPTSLAIGDVNGDGKADLVITQKGSGNVTVFLGDGKGGFDAGVEYAAGTAPENVLLKDLAGHGRLSIVVTDAATGAVDVLRGNGDGTFAKPESYPAIAHPVAIAAGDFGGKERVDLAVASTNGIAVLANDGQGHFSLAANIPLSHPAVALATADLKGEGHHDLVAANADGTLTVLLNNGSGRFQAMAAAKVAAEPLTSIAAGDFRGQGKADLAVTVGKANKLIVLLGRGDGSFEPGADYTVGNGPASVLVADLKGDGGSSLITVNKSANTFSVLAGKGDGTFEPAVDFTAGNAPAAIAAADFNGDGHIDLAILNAGDASISLPLGRGDGTFEAAPSYRSQFEQKAIAAGDLRGIGRSDLVVTNFCGSDVTCKSKGTADVLFANADGTYRHADAYSLGKGPVAVALAAMNGDKKLDLVAVNQIDKTLMVLPGIGKGRFGAPQTYYLSASPRALYVGNFSGDGRPGVAIATDCGRATCSEPGNLDIWLTGNDGKLALAQSYTVGYSPDSIAAGDLRGTGHLDLLVSNRCGGDSSCKSKGTASLLKGDGKGKFVDGGEFELHYAPSAIAIGNLAGKGLDLIVAERGSNVVDVLPGDGKGGFGAPVHYRVGEEPAALAIADFNGDGLPDVAVANFKTSTVSVLYGTAKAALRRAVTMPVGTGPEAMIAVPNGKGGLSSLVTANGNGGATPMGTDITLLRVHSDAKTASTTTISNIVPATPGTVDQEITLTATVSGDPANPPTGSVTFSQTDSTGTFIADLSCIGSGDNTLTQGSTSSTAKCHVFLTQGAYFFQASYSDDSFNSSSSSTVPSAEYDVDTAPTTTTVSTPSSQSADNASLIVTASVAPTTPPASPSDVTTIGGSGSFSIDGSSFAPCSSQGMTFDSGTGTASAHCTIPSGTLSDGLHFLSTTFNSSDANYSGSSGFTFITVGSSPSIAITPTSATVDAAVTLKATVTGTKGTPTGTVTFSGDVPGCGSPQPAVVSLAAGVASCTPTSSSLVATTYSITATYNPDSSSPYLSNSKSGSLAVSKATPTATLTPITTGTTLVAATVDVPYTITAVVVPPGSGSAVPIGGTVTFDNGGTPISGCSGVSVSYDNLTGQASATCTPPSSSLTATSVSTPDKITASYSGDANYGTATTSQYTLAVGAQSTTTTLTSSSNPSPTGAAVTFTATITPPNGVVAGINITGKVTFTYNSGTAIPGCASAITVTNPSAGVFSAACTPSSTFLAMGTYTISAAYGGDTNYSSSTSNNLVQSVGLAATTTTVASVFTSAVTLNQPATTTLTATVTPNATSSVAVSGKVTFLDNNSPIPACPNAVTISSGSATCPNFQLTAGTHLITATYGGDTNYSSSTSSPTSTGVSFKVNQGNISVTMSPAPPTSSPVNVPVTLSATLAPNPTETPFIAFLPSGTVTFLDGTTPITGCTNVPVSVTATGASSSCATSLLQFGTHSINAKFNGDTNYNTGTSTTGAPLSETTNNTTTTVSGSPASASLGQMVTFTATVVPNSGATNPPSVAITGAVAFTDSTPSTTLCASAPLSSGTATCQTSALAAETHTIVATFNPTGQNYATSFGNTSELVSANLITTTLGAPPATTYSGSSTVNQMVVLTDSITPITGHTPSGTVTFTSNGNAIIEPSGCGANGVVALSKTANGGGYYTATCVTYGLPKGTNNIVATYFDTTFGSGVATGTQTVSGPASTVVNITPATPASVVVNSPIALTATVSWGGSGVTPTATAVPAGGVPIVGTVLFFDATTSKAVPGCSAVPVAGAAAMIPASGTATAVCSSIGLTGGTHTITATFTPVSDPSYSVSAASAPVTQMITPEATNITSVTSSPLSAAVNQAVTFTADVVTLPSGTLPPATGVALSGTVSFTATKGSTTIPVCSATLAASGIASCQSSSLASGLYTIKVALAANASFQAASGAETTQQNVGLSPTSTTLKVPSTISVDQPVSFIATVTRQFLGFALAGDLKFTAGGFSIPGGTAQYVDANTGTTVTVNNCDAVPIANAKGGVVTCTSNRLGAGSYPVTATYLGDTNYGVSSQTQTLNVTHIETKVALTPLTTPTIAGHSVTYTAIFTPQLPTVVKNLKYTTLPVPFTGTVAFAHDGTAILACQAAKVSFLAGASTPTGVATCTTTAVSTFNPAGTEEITAVYTGDASYPQLGQAATTATVQSFTLSVSATPQVIVAHGYTSATDPVSPTAIAVSPAPFGGYNHSIVISCRTIPVTPPTGTRLPTCSLPKNPSLSVRPAGVQASLPIVINATGANPGTYQIEVTGTNAADHLNFTTSLAGSLNVFVAEVTSVPTIVSGGHTQGTVDFVLPKGVSLAHLSSQSGQQWCVDVAGPALSTARDPKSLGMTCTANKSTIAADTKGTQTAPLTINVSTSTTPPGSYDLVIQGMGSDQNVYEAVIKVIVTL
jgi:large repetitive protein